MCGCIWWASMCVYVCGYMCVCQRVYATCVPIDEEAWGQHPVSLTMALYLLRHSLSVEPRISQWASLAGQLASGMHLNPVSWMLGLQAAGMSAQLLCGDLTTGLYAFQASVLSTKSPLQPLSSLSKASSFSTTFTLKVSKSPRICFLQHLSWYLLKMYWRRKRDAVGKKQKETCWQS